MLQHLPPLQSIPSPFYLCLSGWCLAMLSLVGKVFVFFMGLFPVVGPIATLGYGPCPFFEDSQTIGSVTVAASSWLLRDSLHTIQLVRSFAGSAYQKASRLASSLSHAYRCGRDTSIVKCHCWCPNWCYCFPTLHTLSNYLNAANAFPILFFIFVMMRINLKC